MKTTWTMGVFLLFAFAACESAELGEARFGEAPEIAVIADKAVVPVEVQESSPPELDPVGAHDERLKLMAGPEAQPPTSLCTAIAHDEAMLAGLHGTTLTIVYADGGQKSLELSFPFGAKPSFPKGSKPEWATVSARDGLVLTSVRGAVDEDGNPMEPDQEAFKCNWKTYVSLFDSDLNLLWEADTCGNCTPKLDANGGVWLYGSGPARASYMTPDGFKLDYEETFTPLGAPVDGKLPAVLLSYNEYNWAVKHWGWFDMDTAKVKYFGQPTFGAWPPPEQNWTSYGHVFHDSKVWGLLYLCGSAQVRYLNPGPKEQVPVGAGAGNLSKTDKAVEHVEQPYFTMSQPTSTGWLIVREQSSKVMTRVKLPDVDAGEQDLFEEVIDQTFPEGFQPYPSYQGQLDADGNVYLVLYKDDAYSQLFRYPIGGASWEPVGEPMSAVHDVFIKAEPGALIATVKKKKSPVSIPSWARNNEPDPAEHIQLIGRPGDGLGQEKTIIIKSTHAQPDSRGRCVAFEESAEGGQSALRVLDWDNGATIHSIDASFREMAFVN